MDMTGEYRIPAPRGRVWEALNDPDVLRASIPGCQSLDRVAENEFAARVVAKVGPVKSTFNGHVVLQNINAPQSYTISGEGKGGAAGFAKGGADVHLEEQGEETVLTYTAKADVGGKLAQLGSRLIQGTAKKMADEFFANFRKQLTAPEPVPTAPPPVEEPAAPSSVEGPAAPSQVERPAAPATLEPHREPGRAREPEPAGDSLAGLAQNRFVWASAAIVIIMIIVMLFR